jgi:hypothetical protein
MARPGFDTSPLLDREFQKAEREHVKGIAPDRDESAETVPELLIHTVKRIHKNPTPIMMVFAAQQSGLDPVVIGKVWDAMWAKA